MRTMDRSERSGDLCIIGGPTGVGKTAVGLLLARRLTTEIISADSMQVYRHLSIGTAKPTAAETGEIPYHLIDCLDPLDAEGREQRFSAACFLAGAEPIIRRLREAGRLPLVVGGTGLYLEALCHGLFEHPLIPPAIRQTVADELRSLTPHEAHERVAAVDPTAAARIHPNDHVRLARTLEVFRAVGETVTTLRTRQAETARSRYRAHYFVLNMPRRLLYERIDSRVDTMIAEGLIDETRSLLAAGLGKELHCMRALGYGFLIDSLQGRLGLDEAVAAVKQSHRNYAKRQLTWFRRVKGAHWISAANGTPAAICDAIEKALAMA